jgi:multiple sugar transport system ATP-binding protein
MLLTPKADADCNTGVTDLAKLELISVSKRFGRVTAIDDNSLVVEDNELFCLFGPPGCGKSTILAAIAGTGGARRWRNSHWWPRRYGALSRRPGLAMVFQNPRCSAHEHARDPAFPLVARADPKHITVVAQVAETLSYNSSARQAPAQLSGRAAARAIGRALVQSRRLI